MMKNLLLIVLLHLALASCANEYSTIKGFADTRKWGKISLFQTVDGNIREYAMTEVGKDGSYGFMIKPEKPGFYALGDDRLNFVIYLKGGEEVNIDLGETKAMLNGKNTKENKALYLWENYAADIRLKSVYFDLTHSTYEDFFPEFETFVSGLDKLKEKLKSGNRDFDSSLQKLVDYETDYYAIVFLYTPRTKHPERSMWPDYYNHIVQESKFVKDDVLQFPYGIRMIDSYVNMAYSMHPKDLEGMDYWDYCLEFLPNKRLKGEYLVNGKFCNLENYNDYLNAMNRYKKYLVTPSLKKRAETIGAELYAIRSGAPAADFTYPDADGNTVSLSDFKGKVVLVDIWATWCGPCRSEIPYLKKLEKEMYGKDVVFISVSLDEEKDRQTWLDFIEKEKLGGVQLFAGGWETPIAEAYDIKGIPRFMVFDKQGNIVDVSAPRPSSPELKELLEKELAK